MTLYYDEDEDALVENWPDEWVEYDEDGRMLYDLSTAQKRSSLWLAAQDAVEAHEPPLDVGDSVAFVDSEGEEYHAVVTETHYDDVINVAYPDDGDLRRATSVRGETPDTEGYYWYA